LIRKLEWTIKTRKERIKKKRRKMMKKMLRIRMKADVLIRCGFKKIKYLGWN